MAGKSPISWRPVNGLHGWRFQPSCERILSCRHDFQKNGKTVKDLYVEMSGTSMAAPHVSGLLASYLSSRREFIGFPTRLKQILLAHCTDLKRDPMHQGAGLPNLVKMLMNT